MIYDDKTLSKLNLEQLKEHEVKLTQEIKTSMKYWLISYNDNEHWAFRVASDVECLKQVRKFIIKIIYPN